MTRPKVDPDKRQRTACACDSCKRRKQKVSRPSSSCRSISEKLALCAWNLSQAFRCNGQKPCNTCTKRQLPCVYTPSNLEPGDSPVGSPTKRRHVESSPRSMRSSLGDMKTQPGHAAPAGMPNATPWDPIEVPPAAHPISGQPRAPVPAPVQKTPTQPSRRMTNPGEIDSDSRSRMSNASGVADEAEVYPSRRMLQDSTGRLLYVGDSASLSYLQWIRMIVEGISGPSDFTTDPRRHMIMEATMTLPPPSTPSGVLPDRHTADVLVESYFVNTTGLVEVFDRELFHTQMNECYEDPLSVEPSVLCSLYMVFAIGLVMAGPRPGSPEEVIIEKLRSDKKVNRAEFFFRNAKSLADPVSGFEDADFWSIQALLLMSLYMLSVSKRNASYAYYGMAVRSAFALGLHREDCDIIFTPVQRRTRRNLWRTLFVLDRFSAASLGRPTAISEEDCSEKSLDFTDKIDGTSALLSEAEKISVAALDAAVKTCHVIGVTLKKVYSKRKISTVVAQEIAEQLEGWNESLHHGLHWRQAVDHQLDPSHGIAILHVNLLQCHSIMLLTRPFFLYILKKAQEQETGVTSKPSRLSQRMEKFAQTCVEASQHTLLLVQTAWESKYLPQCNPFVIHFVFAAGLIIFSNEFASLYHNPKAEEAIRSCKSFLKYCAQYDPQAERVSWIVEAFDRANKSRQPSARRLSLPSRKIPIINIPAPNNTYDPMVGFFTPNRPSSQQSLPSLPPIIKQEPSMSAPGLPKSLPPILPSVLQQPSPEGSGASPVNTGLVQTGVHGMEGISAHETEFDFDSLWPNWHTTAGPVQMSGPQVDPSEAFGTFGLSQVPSGSLLSGNANIPLYPPTDFR
ncbi:fungal specific transcription factor domain-containing protein [Apiospora marii]|uniref:Fungal specific transcription factor domain-containing protein n=1 Tax=Apiospora marii TaxID=335849 RepID=A0ABR1S5B8_9PEZI